MSLSDYAAKRNFTETPEPAAGVAPSTGPLIFTLQRHRATNDHFDLRLELGGVLKSWAVPKGPSDDPADKRFAAPTEDHPYGYACFEGVIPTGHYGAGEMMVWDTGTWYADEVEPLDLNFADPEVRKAHERAAMEQLEAGKLAVTFRGSRIKGSYAMVRTKEGWLMIKHGDALARRGVDFGLERSLFTDRTYDQIARGEPSGFGMADLSPLGPQEAYPQNLKPMKAELGDKPFDSPDWFFEPKVDGIRVLAFCQGPKVRLMTRTGKDQSRQFPAVVRALAEQRIYAVLDGEVVAFEDGRPSFTAMMKRFHLVDAVNLEEADRNIPCVFFAFDLLHLDGRNCRNDFNITRKRWLHALLTPTPLIQYVDHLREHGITFFQAASAAGFEGAMAKRVDAKYDADKRTACWLKLKYTSTREFLICGWMAGEGSRAPTFGAIYMGYWEGDKLRYAGRIGSGFDDASLQEVKALMEPLATKKCPFDDEVLVEGPTVWCEPKLVMEVKFAEVMPSGHLRAPVFMRMRPDYEPSDVGSLITVREAAPETPESAEPMRDPLVESVLTQLETPEKNFVLNVGGEKVNVSNADKKLWPHGTKRDLLRYLARIGPFLLPHLADRPITLIRYPEGIDGEKFFQKHIDKGRPDYIRTVPFWSDTNKRNQDFLLFDTLGGLLWLGQMGTLELHAPAGRIVGEGYPLVFTDSDANLESSIINYPDFIRFDLDPMIYSGKEAEGEEPELSHEGFERTKTVAFWIRDLVKKLGMEAFVKTTGKTGLHVYIPIVRNIDTKTVRDFCGNLSRAIVAEHPRETTIEPKVKDRTGKVYLDYNMNGMGRTLGAIFSPRAHPSASVSMPLTWEELEKAYPEQYTIFNVPEKVEAQGDPWARILDSAVDLQKLVGLG